MTMTSTFCRVVLMEKEFFPVLHDTPDPPVIVRMFFIFAGRGKGGPLRMIHPPVPLVLVEK